MEARSRTAKRVKVTQEVMTRLRTDPDFRSRVLPSNEEPVVIVLRDDSVDEVLTRIRDSYAIGSYVRVVTRMAPKRFIVSTMQVELFEVLDDDAPKPDIEPGRTEIHQDSEWGMLMEYASLHPDEPLPFATFARDLSLSLVSA